ncbi:MAG: phosphoribosyltransferase family protein [Candidatus Acidoferrales bacterium]
MRPLKVLHNPKEIARRVRWLGRRISRDFRGHTLDVVGILDQGFIFMADLVRALDVPTRCHFIRAEMHNITDPNTGKERREIFYTPEIDAQGKNILLVEGVLQSGITTDFLLRRISLHQPRQVKTAVCLDKPADRKVFLEPDYVAFRLASNSVVVGYGLAWDGLHGNLPYLGTWGAPAEARARRRSTRPERKRRARRQPRRKARKRRK